MIYIHSSSISAVGHTQPSHHMLTPQALASDQPRSNGQTCWMVLWPRQIPCDVGRAYLPMHTDQDPPKPIPLSASESLFSVHILSHVARPRDISLYGCSAHQCKLYSQNTGGLDSLCIHTLTDATQHYMLNNIIKWSFLISSDLSQYSILTTTHLHIKYESRVKKY